MKYLGPKLRRRAVLQGLGGLAVGLPFLEALEAKPARAAAPAIKRFGVVFACNGVDMTRWFPNGAFGALTEAHLNGTANAPLAPYVDKLLIPRGVHMSPRGWGRDGGGGDDHGRGMACKLTAHPPDAETGLAQGPSVDFVVAEKINPSGRAPLNLLVGRAGSYKGLGYISYRGPGAAVAPIKNPWNAYSNFMNLNDPGAAEARMRIRERRQSSLDFVSDSFDDLKRGPLSADDKRKLDAHFTAIREIETGVTATGLSCLDEALADRAHVYKMPQGPDVEAEVEYPKIADLHLDIMAIALACDATRVATVQFDKGAAGPTFRWDGMSHEYNHHKLSHGKVRDDCFGDSTDDGCSDINGYADMLFDIDRWHQGKLARLLSRLDSYVEADGKTVLDNSVILSTNELSDGRAHSFMDLPYVLAGSCGGYFKPGRYVQLGDGTQYDDKSAPHNKLLNTIVNAMGIESAWFGLAEGMGGATMKGGVYAELLA